MILKKFKANNTILGCMALVAVAFSSCKTDPLSPGVEYMPDMYRSASYETYSPNPNFKDSLTARKPVLGTVSRGHSVTGDIAYGVNNSIYPFPNTPEGYEAAGAQLKNPFQATHVALDQGKRIYTNFCTPCHGTEGKGDGTIVANGKFPGPPPSYSGPLKNLPEGKIFHSVTYGKGLMGSHASQLTKEERWKVTMYVQSLQRLGDPSGANAANADSAAAATKDKNKQAK